MENPREFDKKIKSYKEEIKLLIKDNKYSDAESITNQVLKMKKINSQRELKHILFAQSNEKSMLEKKFSEDKEKTQNSWNLLIEANNKDFLSQEQELIKKFKIELELEKQRLEKTLQYTFKLNATLQNLKVCKEKAAKVGKYSYAEILHNKIEESKVLERARFDSQKKSEINQILAKLQQEQSKKLENLRKKHQTELKLLINQNSSDMNKLIKKYENSIQKMKSTHEIRKNIKLSKHKILVQNSTLY